MRIAFLVGRFPSLSETFVLNQITGLIDAGHEVDIYAVKRSEDGKEHTEVERYRLMERTYFAEIPASKRARIARAMRVFFRYLLSHPALVLRALNPFRFGREALSLSLLLRLEPFLQNAPYDILNCHFGKQGLRGMRLKELGISGKLVVNFHGYDISQSLQGNDQGFYRHLFERADLLLPVSEFWKRKLISLGAKPERIQVHHMGIDVERFEFKPRQPSAGGAVHLFTVGRLVEKKGIAESLQAVARLAARRPDWTLRYVIIGDGPLCKLLQDQARALGLEGIVQFHGAAAQDEVLRRMMEAHLYLLPSVTSADGDQEGIPVSMMEAMATGMPVLSTRHSGIPELVEDGVTGLLVEERDTEALADALEWIIQRPEQWSEMGWLGRAAVASHFNIAALNQKLILIYERLLRGSYHPAETEPARAKSTGV